MDSVNGMVGEKRRMWSGEVHEREADESAQRRVKSGERGVVGGRDLCERIRDRKEVAGIGRRNK